MARPVDRIETQMPTIRLLRAAASIAALPQSEAYHLVVKPASGKVVEAALLNEKIGKSRIGR